jgi:transposase
MDRKQREQRRPIQDSDLDALEQINLDAAGIDVGANEIYVAVPRGRDVESVRVFGPFTADLERLADWLRQCGITTVAMESTGVYWIPLFEMLDSRGLDVCLVNARHLKNVSGRKSDVLDCQWLQRLHTCGLLRASFRPSDDVCALRALVRQRGMLVQYRAAHIQHMQKALQQMNVQLTRVLSDITGVTGMKIIRAIVAGERDGRILASYRDAKCKHSVADIVAALQGNYRREHLFALRQGLSLYDIYDTKIRECDAELEAMYAEWEAPQSPDDPATQPPAPRTSKPRKNQAHFDLATSLYHMAGVDLTRADGIDALTAQTILSEIGADVSAWPTVKHFSAWLCLCSQNRITGGKVKRRGTAPTSNRVSTALRVAAQALHRSNSANGAFYRRICARRGPAIAVTATAHRLARQVYFMLKHRTDYVDQGTEEYERRHQERALANLKRRAARLGFALTPVAGAASVS